MPDGVQARRACSECRQLRLKDAGGRGFADRHAGRAVARQLGSIRSCAASCQQLGTADRNSTSFFFTTSPRLISTASISSGSTESRVNSLG